MNKKKKPKMDENTAAKKITKLFKPLLHKYSGDINDRIELFNNIENEGAICEFTIKCNI